MATEGELGGTTKDFSALKQQLEGRKSEEIPSFDESVADSVRSSFWASETRLESW